MSTKTELEKDNKILLDRLEKIESHDPIRHKDETRSEIALFVVHWFFYLIAIVLVGVPIYNQIAFPELKLSVVDVVTVLAGVISGPFGFVVGYYFKGTEKD